MGRNKNKPSIITIKGPVGTELKFEEMKTPKKQEKHAAKDEIISN